MSDFKLIAIRPLDGCDKKHLKILNSEKIYQFYYDYVLEERIIDGKVVVFIDTKPTTPQDLYSLEYTNKVLPVNISAVVGKNGSGKSVLFELLYMAVYNLALERNILNAAKWKAKLIEHLKLEIYYSIAGQVFCLRIQTGDKIANERNQLSFFQIVRYTDKGIYRDFRLNEILDDDKDLFENYFFYTIAINYSLYGLNSVQVGDWINPLFHKNDGYQTPIVLCPYRNKGVIDINIENDLVKQRLLANILEPIAKNVSKEDSLRHLANSKIADRLVLNLDYQKLEEHNGTDFEVAVKNSYDFARRLFSAYTKFEFADIPSGYKKNQLEIYSVAKLVKICRLYPRYRRFIKKVDDRRTFVEFDKLSERFCNDQSHVTFKLKQVFNYLAYGHVSFQFPNGPKSDAVKNFPGTTISLAELETKIKVAKNKAKKKKIFLSTIELIPPSIFDTSIILADNTDFEDLSSGEKQKIHSISSLIYHLTNLNSVFKNGDSKDKEGASVQHKYRYINIHFDEVELYYHPEFQRTFIHDLLQYLSRINVDNIKYISALNLCFATHSPFILSDIPIQNILRLKKGRPDDYDSDERTFAANIHELLATDFFLDVRFMGEWAHRYIIALIEEVNNLTKITDAQKEQLFKRIDLIGEPFIRVKLQEMVFEKINLSEISKLEHELMMKQKEVARLATELNKKKNDTNNA